MPAQILRANPAVVTARFLNTAGVAVDPGTVLVDVTGLDGTAIVTDAATTTGTDDEPRTYTLTSTHTADLDTLTVTFTSASLAQSVSETVEVVGALLFTVAEARAFDGAAMGSTTTYPTAAIEEARARITDQFETICGVSFVPRYRLDILNGAGLTALTLPRMQVTAIRSVEQRTAGSAGWTAYDAGDLADLYIEDWGYLIRETRGSFTSGRRNVRIGYEHGYPQVPFDIKQAALLALKYEIASKNYGDRTISTSNEFGTVQFWTPGVSGRGSAIHPVPEVDRILKLYMSQVPVIA